MAEKVEKAGKMAAAGYERRAVAPAPAAIKIGRGRGLRKHRVGSIAIL